VKAKELFGSKACFNFPDKQEARQEFENKFKIQTIVKE